MTLGSERCALELYLVVAYIRAVRKRHAILDPLLTEHFFSDQTFSVLALIIFVACALGCEVSCGALIDYVAHFNDGALYSVRGTETKARIATTFARSTVNVAYSGESSNVHVLHFDCIEKAGPCEAENIVIGVGRVMVGVCEVEVHRHVVHRRSLRVVPS